MDLKKVKLVVSDMDGTLLNSKGEVSSLFFELFTKLKQQNIHFCAASGRQYQSIIEKLSTIKDDIFVIAENGSLAKKEQDVLVLNTLTAKEINKIVTVLRTVNNAHTVLCGKNGAFIESKNKNFINLFQEYYNAYTIVNDLTLIANKEECLKIAIYHSDSSEKHIYPKVKSLEGEFLIKISSKNWLDISDKKATKGNALKTVQKKLNITKSETMVFGDYHNDIEMLQEADFSFAMGNAHKDIKKLAKFATANNDNFGVERVLEKLIKSKS